MSHKEVTSIELLVVCVSFVAAAACIPAGSTTRIAIAISVAAGIACVGLWVWDKERAMKAARELARGERNISDRR